MTATVITLPARPPFYARGVEVVWANRRPISVVLADALVRQYLREIHELTAAGKHAEARGLVVRCDSLLAARVAATTARLTQSDQPTPPSAA